MGKKVSWFSAIKKVFSNNSKQKVVNDHETEKKNSKKWGLGKIRNGGTTSFIPLYRKPSSIEKILGDAEREHQTTQPTSSSSDQRRTPSMPTTVDRTPSTPTKVDRTPSMPTRIVHHHNEVKYHITNNSKSHHIAAIKIQAAYKGYMARRNIRALKGMVRLQGVIQGQNVKRQTMNAMRQMQLLVKVQTQIQSRRIHLLENQALHHHNLHKNDRELESGLGRWSLSQQSETGQHEEWDDSLLTKEEIDERMQRKVEALVKKERILAYANSHQWFKAGTAQAYPMEMRSGALPWWWIRIEQQLPKHSLQPTFSKNNLTHPSPVQARSPRPQSKQSLTPRSYTTALEPSPRPQSRQSRFGNEILTPKSSKSPMTATMTRTKNVPVLSSRAPQSNSSTPMKHGKPRTIGDELSFSMPLRDDESFISCPPLSVPNYMTPTVSAKAKLRGYSNLNLGSSPSTPTTDRKRRLSLPLSQSIGSIKWKRASSLFSSKDSSSQRIQGNHRFNQSTSNLSVDSTTSMTASVGRKPFNRFV